MRDVANHSYEHTFGPGLKPLELANVGESSSG